MAKEEKYFFTQEVMTQQDFSNGKNVITGYSTKLKVPIILFPQSMSRTNLHRSLHLGMCLLDTLCNGYSTQRDKKSRNCI